jgi:hypothetical protein
MDTPWGRVPVVSMPELIELKKTRRLYDYEVVTNLVRLRVAEEMKPSRTLLRWAIANSFRAEDRASFRERLGERVDLDQCRREVAADLAVRQQRDAAYWRTRIAELRRMRRNGDLLPVGLPVADLVGRAPSSRRGTR